jgi:hypothetical protein
LLIWFFWLAGVFDPGEVMMVATFGVRLDENPRPHRTSLVEPWYYLRWLVKQIALRTPCFYVDG